MNNKEIFDFLSQGNIFSITKITKQHWKLNSFSYSTTPRPDFGMMLLLEGRIKFVFEENELFANAGDIIFLPKGAFYEAIMMIGEGNVENYLVNFDTNDVSCKTKAPTKILEDRNGKFRNFFDQMLIEKLSDTKTELGYTGYFYLLLNAIVRSYTYHNNNEDPLISKACLLLQELDLSIPDVAKKCCISESGLRREFKKVLGISPLKYRNTLKLKQAAHMLESTDMSIAQIADFLHFFDTAHFCKLFKSYYKMSPRQYTQNKKL